MKPLFVSHHKNGGRNSPYISVAGVELASLIVRVRLLIHFQTHFTSAWWWREDHIRLKWFHTYAQDLETPGFFLSFLITVVIIPWLADLQPVLNPDLL